MPEGGVQPEHAVQDKIEVGPLRLGHGDVFRREPVRRDSRNLFAARFQKRAHLILQVTDRVPHIPSPPRSVIV